MIDNRARALSTINDSQLEEMANLIADIENGSPKGVYATLAALQAAFPTGTTGAYIVTADGNWYYWNSSAWTIGGTYQAAGIADQSIQMSMLDNSIDGYSYPFDGKYATMSTLSAANRLKYRKAIIDVRIFNADQTKKYALSRIKRNGSGGEWNVLIHELSTDLETATIKASFYSTTYVEPENKIDIIMLSEYVSSGISGYIVIDWSQITEGSSLSFSTTDIKFSMLDVKTYLPNLVEPEIDIVLPPNIYNVVGTETNVYFDNVILCNHLNDFQIDVTCSIGKQHNECFRTNGLAGSYTLTITVYRDSRLVAHSESTIVSKAATVGSGLTKKCLVIGDSTTAGGTTTGELLTIASADVMDLTLIGTKGSVDNLHEGISGWSINQFYTDVSSPFVFLGVFNFSEYMSTNAYSGLDHILINLGINDVASITDDVALGIKMNTMCTQLEAMITNIHTYDANIRIGLCVTIPPSYNQDAFGDSYYTGYNRWRYKRNQFLLTKKLISQFKAREGELIYLVPINTNLDTVNNMQLSEAIAVNARNTSTVVRQNNGVHPADIGYYQCADVMWAYLKSFES